MRPLRPVRRLPAGSGAPDVVLTRLQFLPRIGTGFARTAPADSRPLALRDGSDLLPLRLDLHCSWVMRFVAPPTREVLAGFAGNPSTPHDHAFLACPTGLPERPWGGGRPPDSVIASWSAQ